MIYSLRPVSYNIFCIYHIIIVFWSVMLSGPYDSFLVWNAIDITLKGILFILQKSIKFTFYFIEMYYICILLFLYFIYLIYSRWLKWLFFLILGGIYLFIGWYLNEIVWMQIVCLFVTDNFFLFLFFISVFYSYYLGGLFKWSRFWMCLNEMMLVQIICSFQTVFSRVVWDVYWCWALC